MTFVTQFNLFAAQVDGRFVAVASKAERVVLFDRASCLGIEQFVGVFGRRQEPDAGQVHAEAVDRLHAESRMFAGVVLVFDPVGELLVECTERREIEVSHEKLIADAAEEPFDLSFRGRISNGRMTKNTADASAHECDFLAAIDRTVVDQQLLRQASFVERGAECLDHRIGVFVEEEFSVTQHATGVVDEGDQFGLPPLVRTHAGQTWYRPARAGWRIAC